MSNNEGLGNAGRGRVAEERVGAVDVGALVQGVVGAFGERDARTGRVGGKEGEGHVAKGF